MLLIRQNSERASAFLSFSMEKEGDVVYNQ